MKHLLSYIISGLLLAFSWPTYGLSFFVFFAFVPLLVQNLKCAQAQTSHYKLYFFNYITFFTWNIITTGWLFYSSAFGMLFAVLVNTALMAFIPILVLKFKRLGFTASSSLFVSLWLAFEYLHYHWEFSWPWLSLGNVFSESTSLIQWYEYTGVFGGSLWVLLTNVIIARVVILYQQHKDISLLYRGLVRFTLIMILPIGLSYLLMPPKLDKVEVLETIVLQPNIDPYEEKYQNSDFEIAQQLITQLEPHLKFNEQQLILAPETVFAQGTELKNYKQSAAKFFANQVLSHNPQAKLVSGISAYRLLRDVSETSIQSNKVREGLWYNDFNSAVFESVDTTDFYHKSKLVVGVENFPYKALLEPVLGNIMLDLGGTVSTKTTQTERDVFQLDDSIRVAPVICYESVYGEYVTDYVANGASILGIITNDAWWGNTQGHQQHWSYAKLRAIETRKAVARSANTGFSGFIDRDGRELLKSSYNTKVALSYKVPIYHNAPTFYVIYGDIIPRLAILLASFIVLFSITKRRH